MTFKRVATGAKQVKFSIFFHLCLCHLAFSFCFESGLVVWNKLFDIVFQNSVYKFPVYGGGESVF